MPSRFVNMDELPLSVYNRPLSLSGNNVGWGFVKKVTRPVKRTVKKASKPFVRAAKTVSRPASKAYKATVPKGMQRQIAKASKTAVHAAKKYGAYAVIPGLMLVKHATQLLGKLGMAVIKKYFGGAMKKLTRRRARYIAYQRRGATNPTPQETVEATRWATKYAKSQGLLGQLTAAVGKKTKELAKDPKVQQTIAQKMSGKPVPHAKAKVSGMSGDFIVGADPVTLSLIAAAVPIIVALINAFLNRAAKQGAPADPRQASPEQNLMSEIAQGYANQTLRGASQPGGAQFALNPIANYARQKAAAQFGPVGDVAAQYLTQAFQPPVSNQPAMTYNYPEPEPQQFDFPPPPEEIEVSETEEF